MLFRVLSGFTYKVLCGIDSEKKAEGATGKEVRNHLQREWCQGSEVWRGDRSSGRGGRCPVVPLTPYIQPRA